MAAQRHSGARGGDPAGVVAVSGLDGEIAQLFAQVLTLCDKEGLIGRQMFAIDGVELPSNASKGKSGHRADFIRQAEKMEAAAKRMLERHRANDEQPVEPDLAEKEARQRQKLRSEAKKLRTWLAEHQAAPEAQPALMAQLIAAVTNGPMTRKDKKYFAATDFMPIPWRIEAAATKPRHLTRRELARALKASFKR